MKNIIKVLCLGLVLVFLTACDLKELEVISVPEDEEVSAIIYHSVMMGIDAGDEYTYYIYKDNDNYLYFKYISSITIAGSGEESFKKSGRLKSKDDFNIIIDDIKADDKSDAESYVSYDYYENKIRTRYSTMDELLDALYK